jgi:predicted esterase
MLRICLKPILNILGSADEINPPDLTERVYKKLLEIGATKMRYTNYPGYGHAIWDKAQSEPSFYDWMFDFKKSP